MSWTWQLARAYGLSNSVGLTKHQRVCYNVVLADMTTVAEQNPQSYVIGTDLSAIQPERDVSNCVFQKDDAEAEWVFRAPGQPNGVLFDYVHMRLVCSCFDDTQQVMRQAFDNMKPGGWIELQDAAYDTTVKTPLIRWYEGMNKGLATIGRDITRPKKYKQWLEEVGCKISSAFIMYHPLTRRIQSRMSRNAVVWYPAVLGPKTKG